MAVLPPYSRQHVPTALQDLMIDIHSPIIDFYPTEFELDKNGKTADWEAIVKIPFIDESRLLKAVKGSFFQFYSSTVSSFIPIREDA